MTRISRHTVTIGPEGFHATCAVPREGLGWWEGLVLNIRGRMDARRNLGVQDVDATHALHRLEAAYRRAETEAVRRIDEALSAVDRELAPLVRNADTPLPTSVPVPAAAELDAMDDASRLRWAQEVKDARRNNAQAAAARERREQAGDRIAALRSIREALSVEGDGVRRQWAEAYRIRAACYTRARFGRRFAEMSAAPAVPTYVAAVPPRVVRESDGGLRVPDAVPTPSKGEGA